jgi:hypothetical protein
MRNFEIILENFGFLFPGSNLTFLGKPFLLSEFFPAKIFSCSERFPFSKKTEKILAGKKLTEQKSFFAEQKRLVQLFSQVG